LHRCPPPKCGLAEQYTGAARATGPCTFCNSIGAPWARSFTGANPGEDMEVDELVTTWSRLGFVLEKDGAYFEVDRLDEAP